MKPTEIKEFIEKGNVEELRALIKNGILVIENGKIKYASKEFAKDQEEKWDKLQLTKKLLLNSLYGAVLNPGCRFYDKRIGQSTTLTGRQIVKHMTSVVNEIFTGEYDYLGKTIIYNDTDSEVGSTVHRTNFGDITVEELFARCTEFWDDGNGKEYAAWPELQVASYDPESSQAYLGHINYIYRHRVSKEQWEITDSQGHSVCVTGDHSVMVERNGSLIEAKPREILNTDTLVSCTSDLQVIKLPILRITQLSDLDNEYVYDIGMKNTNHPWFFGNNILLHNSVYFSAYPALKDQIDSGAIAWNRDNVVKLYDTIGDEVNATFPDFMHQSFHVPHERGEVIRAGREIVATKGLFITKKRYAVLYYDKDGKRTDTAGKPGKIKAMGLDLKRSDTPKFIQAFLSTVLEKVLTGVGEQEILDDIVAFRKQFREIPAWEKGSPRRVNNLTAYSLQDQQKGKVTMPGHVRAGINWNFLRKMHGDVFSSTIGDGTKVVVCKLKNNPLGLTSIAYPVDEQHLPEWFKSLPFDEEEMENLLIDEKLNNLIGLLKYDLESTRAKTTFNSLFQFGD